MTKINMVDICQNANIEFFNKILISYPLNIEPINPLEQNFRENEKHVIFKIDDCFSIAPPDKIKDGIITHTVESSINQNDTVSKSNEFDSIILLNENIKPTDVKIIPTVADHYEITPLSINVDENNGKYNLIFDIISNNPSESQKDIFDSENLGDLKFTTEIDIKVIYNPKYYELLLINAIKEFNKQNLLNSFLFSFASFESYLKYITGSTSSFQKSFEKLIEQTDGITHKEFNKSKSCKNVLKSLLALENIRNSLFHGDERADEVKNNLDEIIVKLQINLIGKKTIDEFNNILMDFSSESIKKYNPNSLQK